MALGPVALAVFAWHQGSATLSYSTFSPRGVYRIDSYSASWLGRLMHHDASLPGFVRLYRVDPPQLLGESHVVDLNDNGQVFWMMDFGGKVSVGMDITFNNIPAECPSSPCPNGPQRPPSTTTPP